MIRPRRSLLFMPGSNARALEKARNLPAEASSSISRIRWHPTPRRWRATNRAGRRAGGFGKREILIRSTRWIRVVHRRRHHGGKVRPDGILVPKVSSPRI